MKYFGELTINFENGASGTRTFEDTNKYSLEAEINAVLTQIIAYGKKFGKSSVSSHRISVKSYQDRIIEMSKA